MTDEPMTLIERLRNPAWEADTAGVILHVERTRADMDEAANQIEKLRTALEKIRFTEGIQRGVERIALAALKTAEGNLTKGD